MNERKVDELEARLARLPRDIEPTRDLWPGITTAIKEQAPAARSSAAKRPFTVWRIAASLLLMVTSSAITYAIMQRSHQQEVSDARNETAQQLQPMLAAMPASFAGQQLGVEYTNARAALDAQFTRYLKSLSPAERSRIERSLADLHRTANELSAMLAEHPSDPLLQELLLSTYQNELGLLTRVNELGAANSLGADL